MLLPKNQKKAIYSFPPTNKWPDRDIKKYNESISQSICELKLKQLGKAIANN